MLQFICMTSIGENYSYIYNGPDPAVVGLTVSMLVNMSCCKLFEHGRRRQMMLFSVYGVVW
jgi:hypothetical protein